MGVVTVQDSAGRAYDIPEEQLSGYLSQGFTVQTPTERAAPIVEAAREDRFGGPVSATLASGTLGALGTVTGGLSDAALAAAGGGEGLRTLQELHPIAHGLGAVAGALVPTGAAGLASRAGTGVTEGLGGGLLARAAGGATEGAIFGAGSGISELATSADPLTYERAASTISSNMLFGGAVGGLAGAGSALVERGLQRAGKAIDEGVAARTAQDAVPDDLAALDVKGLKSARDAELDKLAEVQTSQRAAARSSVADDVIAYRDTVQEVNPWLVITEGEDAARLSHAKKALRKLLDDPKGLRENPAALAKPLRVEEQALQNAIANRAAIAAKLDEVNAKIATDLEERLAARPAAGAAAGAGAEAGGAESIDLTGKAARRYASFADVKLPKGGALSIARDDAQEFLDALKNGRVASDSRTALDGLDGLLAQNRALQERIKAAMAPLTPRAELASERLTAIENAQEILRAPKPAPSLAQQAFSGTAFGAITGAVHAIPVIGQIPGVAHFIGAKGAELATRLVSGKLGDAVGTAAARHAQAVKGFLDVASKVTPAAVPVATKVLSEIRYATRRKDEPQPTTLPELYRQRTDEIKQLTEYDPTGTPKMRPDARQALADRLSPLGATDPILADRVESIAVRRIEYLSRIMPRQPDIAGAQIGPNRWHPDEMAMRSFARSMAAVEDPHGVLERAIHGQVTPEDVAAMNAVHPEMLKDFADQVTAELPTLRGELPFHRQLALSMLTGQPVTPALDPRVLGVLQGQFAIEPGTAGGTQAPRVRAQFGSIHSIDAPTAAQHRAQGAHQ